MPSVRAFAPGPPGGGPYPDSQTLSLAALTAVAGSAAVTANASAATIATPVVVGPGEHIAIDFAGSARVKLSANNAAVAQGETAKGTLYLLARRA